MAGKIKGWNNHSVSQAPSSEGEEMADEKKDKEVAENLVAEVEALPKAIVRRVVKEKLSQISADYEICILRDSLQAFSESARIFIHYLSAT